VKVATTFVAILLSAALLGGCASWGRPIGMPLRSKTRFASEWTHYQKVSGFKALAVAGNLGGTYVSGWSSDDREQEQAIADALKHCEQRRRDRGIAESCRVYAIGDEVSQGESR
jgi:hypothetical protein